MKDEIELCPVIFIPLWCASAQDVSLEFVGLIMRVCSEIRQGVIVNDLGSKLCERRD